MTKAAREKKASRMMRDAKKDARSYSSLTLRAFDRPTAAQMNLNASAAKVRIAIAKREF